MSEKIRRGLICPVVGDGEDRIDGNISKAIDWLVKTEGRGVQPIVPFLTLRKILDENNPEHREAGLLAGRIIYGTCHEGRVVTWGQEISEGMQGDIDFFNMKGIPVIYEDGPCMTSFDDHNFIDPVEREVKK